MISKLSRRFFRIAFFIAGAGMSMGTIAGAPITKAMNPLYMASAFAEDQVASIKVAKLSVKGMTCEGCSQNIQKKLKGIDGVRETKVDVKRGSAVVTYDDRKVKPETIAKAINEIGYKAHL